MNFENFELTLLRICRNKVLFDESLWSKKARFPFPSFSSSFAVYCAKRNLFMPFELFVITFPKTKEVDLSDVQEPFIQFIWDLWVKRDPGATFSGPLPVDCEWTATESWGTSTRFCFLHCSAFDSSCHEGRRRRVAALHWIVRRRLARVIRRTMWKR
jgi:hypothetical protein